MRKVEVEEQKTKGLKKFSFKKIGLIALFVVGTVAAFGVGYAASLLWERVVTLSFEETPKISYEGWQVYKNETYGLGLRYPIDWEVQEVDSGFVVFRPKVEEGSTPPKEYVDLKVSSNENRGVTACEADQSSCSFHTNGIFGERISTPEAEIIFFSQGENDFTLSLFKYGEADFLEIFEAMGDSLRFVTLATEGTQDGQND
ncbi:hypothetical protein GTO10_02285 [Candidatus Saccharibacteria bacterium]|nr:hypothetical protein [Candidatus Saccharibacteria bacterium]